MSKIFNYDNKVFAALGKVFDCSVLSVLWFFFCLPLVTAGASTTAMYYTVHKCIRNGKGYVAKTFFTALKENFKHSTILWLIQLILMLITSSAILISFQYLKAGEKVGLSFYVYIVIWLLLMVWNIYTYCYTARFVMSVKGTLKNAAIFAIVHLPSSLLILLIFIVSLVIYYYIPIMIFLVPGVAFILFDLILEKIFRKYMSEEDLKKEQEDDLLNDDFM